MSKNLAVLGLAALAVLAVSAIGASAAQAAPEFHCTSTSANCFVTSDVATDNEFTVNNGDIKCTASKVVGTNPKTTTTITMSATYESCKAFGVKASVNMKSCDYLLHLVAGGTAPFPVTTDVVCTSEPITVTPVGIACVITIGAQTGLTGMTVSNSGGTEPTHIRAVINVLGITYTETGAECATPGTHINGNYHGTQTLTAFEDNSGVEGANVGLHVF